MPNYNNSLNSHGKFVISLDFELIWGVLDKVNKDTYLSNILGVHQMIPKLLKLFKEFNINATFSTVGFLFHTSMKELLENLPSVKPNYDNISLSPYNYIKSIEGTVYLNEIHFGLELINEIKKHPEHEIGTHTYSHYYCLENGQNLESFKADIINAILIAKKHKINISSLVFPRNQFNNSYLKICEEHGIITYRGNEDSWIYSAKKKKEEYKIRRLLRLLDSYINISGHNCYTDFQLHNENIVNIPSSRFLRPYNKNLKILEPLRLNRIKSDMTYAAKNNQTYHLWWHPHNFGINQNENFEFLKNILMHYLILNKKYGFQSYTMSNLAKSILNHA